MNDIIERLGRTEGSGDGVVAVFDRHFDTSPSDLWQACTDPARLERSGDRGAASGG